MSAEFITGREIKTQYKVSTSTLHNWSSENEQDETKIFTIRTPGRTRLYRAKDVQKLIGKKQSNDIAPTIPRKDVIYARVSSSHQKKDLERQIRAIQVQYPNIEKENIIQDIGSGINFKRHGFTKLLQQIHQNHVKTVILLFRDRLCRFGFELVEWLCEQHQTKIVVLNSEDRDQHSVEQELSEDLLAVVNFFVAKNNGLRAGINRRRRCQAKAQDQKVPSETDGKAKEDTESMVWDGEVDMEPSVSPDQA